MKRERFRLMDEAKRKEIIGIIIDLVGKTERKTLPNEKGNQTRRLRLEIEEVFQKKNSSKICEEDPLTFYSRFDYQVEKQKTTQTRQYMSRNQKALDI